MIWNPHDPAPLDRCKITTYLPLQAAFFHSQEIAHTAFKAAGHDWYERSIGDASYAAGQRRTVRIHLLNFQAITLLCERREERWMLIGYEINPGATLYGHTGRTLESEELAHALTIARDQIAPLLLDPASAWKLIPGVVMAGESENPSYWSYLEIPLNLYDPEGCVFQSLSNVHYPHMRQPLRYEGETVTLGKRSSDLVLCIYRRERVLQKQLRKIQKVIGNLEGLVQEEIFPATRVEVRLRGEKLKQCFDKPGNLALVNGKQRLVRFTGKDLVAAHLHIAKRLEGIRQYREPVLEESAKGCRNGRFIGAIAATEGIPLDRLFTLYEHCSAPSGATMERVRKASREEHARHVCVSSEELFSEAAFVGSVECRVPALEGGDYERRRVMTDVDLAILAIYRYGRVSGA